MRNSLKDVAIMAYYGNWNNAQIAFREIRDSGKNFQAMIDELSPEDKDNVLLVALYAQNQAKTPNQLVKSLETIVEEHESDIGATHVLADRAMVDVLENLGYDDAMNIFNSIRKWYA